MSTICEVCGCEIAEQEHGLLVARHATEGRCIEVLKLALTLTRNELERVAGELMACQSADREHPGTEGEYPPEEEGACEYCGTTFPEPHKVGCPWRQEEPPDDW